MSASTPTTAADSAPSGAPPPVAPAAGTADVTLLTRVLQQLAAWLPPAVSAPDWQAGLAWRWVRHGQQGALHALPITRTVALTDLHGIDDQRTRFDRNMRQFVQGLPANHVLLTGARGCGKSSLVRAALTAHGGQGLRVIECDREGLADLPALLAQIAGRPERFLLFCDDLSFDGQDPAYTALKSLLDGSVAAVAPNVLVVATSNRRHLMPDLKSDNQQVRHLGNEIHPGEAIEEKVSLSDRFGLWLSFYPMDQETYLAIAAHWAAALGAPPADTAAFRAAALDWALTRSSRSGRSAWQFARDWAGQQGLAG